MRQYQIVTWKEKYTQELTTEVYKCFGRNIKIATIFNDGTFQALPSCPKYVINKALEHHKAGNNTGIIISRGSKEERV